jgi:hypothetical protein
LVSPQLRTFSVPDLAVELVEPPPAALPPKLKAKVYFDAAKEPHHLHFLGPMTDAERDALVGLATDPADPEQAAYLTAVQQLYDQAELVVPAVGDAFLTADGPDDDGALVRRRSRRNPGGRRHHSADPGEFLGRSAPG